ncbi:DNA-binding GntR family transcriptional regulator [Microbacterium ginsengiterrae]|uniref:DNA-binding GntR family transcriptional regulator n=1 Tax=Microbacterium ginsengiterrae TaxID=546115 RepID=A0A7W9C9R6_9MICO|nr:GntR family transcriptional regulator [Microbacterium ginsengiterrae]MBB5741653.1 DNA-binding GntR family transcriptional regulator [Microbacterium ginsengiterrae]
MSENSTETPEGGVSAHVYQKLFRMVMSNDIAPGSRLNIDKIAVELGVSTTPVREALARLETQELVTKEPMRGYFVSPIMSGEEFDDLWEFRLLLEVYAASRAAERANADDIDRLRRELASIRPVRLLDDDYTSMATFRNHDQCFHELVLDIAGNRQASKALAQAHVHTRMLRMRFVPLDGYHAIQEHDDIIDAIAAADPDRAAEAMRTHVQNAHERIRAYAQ